MLNVCQITINSRIVVVGASDVGIAFLETLVYWYVWSYCTLLVFNFTIYGLYFNL